ncbi:hypothetical protein RS130_12690 [Paraglaciecola aquimarina]|uniref:DNA repair protein n=1 Tax=Paraglaciecola aquimarina TaxID=1235557 RepID=A0ABU3SXB7_9ALTE|nr:hypothetical protein [Paraglaciecola aquimarina]MDU0354660.1 hypothetical protein [Paraglaciecola aquimarina]
MFTVIIVLIIVLVLVGIIVNAIQQHNNKIESERRAQLAKQRNIIEGTEATILASESIPTSQRLMFILQRRILHALKILQQMKEGSNDIARQIKTLEDSIKALNINTPPPSEDNFQLPQGDKQVIQFIRGVKTLRTILRAEFKKGRIESRVFLAEDKLLESLQLRANVDTLVRRVDVAIRNNQMGSARQCLEKAIGALSSQPSPTAYMTNKQAQLEDQLNNLENSLKNVNKKDVAEREASEKDELDELFSEKKKW